MAMGYGKKGKKPKAKPKAAEAATSSRPAATDGGNDSGRESDSGSSRSGGDAEMRTQQYANRDKNLAGMLAGALAVNDAPKPAASTSAPMNRGGTTRARNPLNTAAAAFEPAAPLNKMNKSVSAGKPQTPENNGQEQQQQDKLVTPAPRRATSLPPAAAAAAKPAGIIAPPSITEEITAAEAAAAAAWALDPIPTSPVTTDSALQAAVAALREKQAAVMNNKKPGAVVQIRLDQCPAISAHAAMNQQSSYAQQLLKPVPAPTPPTAADLTAALTAAMN